MAVRVQLPNATGTWATAVDAVNSLIDDLARPTGEVARVISAAAQGDLTQKMALSIEGRPMKGEFQRIGEVVNSMVVVDALSRLSAEHRAVREQVYLKGNTVTEAAEALGIPPGTVKSRSYYALRALREAGRERLAS